MLAFGPRGVRLWKAMCEQVDGEGGLALLEEVCRTADRLDRLEALLSGDVDVWFRLAQHQDGTTIEVQVDSALSEARQQGNALRQLLAALPLKGSNDDDGESWLDMPAAVLDSP